jgi:O-antigen/teichoic acid export membrane protein
MTADPRADLSGKFIKGGAWSFALRLAGQCFALARLIILARLLTPADFGVVGIALLVIATLEAFSQTGLAHALVQLKEEIDDALDTAWTVGILCGALLFTLLFALAPRTALFFHTPQASAVIRLIGVSLLLQGLTNIGIVRFHRDLDFRSQFRYELSGTLADFLVSVTVALLYRSVWALVAGLLAGDLTRLVVSYLIHPYRPRPSLRFSRVRHLFDFSKWISGSSMMIFIGSSIDGLVVGRLLGAAPLGLYRVAGQAAQAPFTEVARVVGRAAFPAYARLQQSRDQLREAYRRILRVSAAIYIPAALVIIVLAGDFTAAVLGRQWLPMVPALRILAAAGLLKSITGTGSPLFAGAGSPRYDFLMQLARSGFMVLFIYPATRLWGLEGAALCAAVSLVLPLALCYRFANRLTGMDPAEYRRILAPLLCAGGALAATAAAITWFLPAAGRPLAAAALVLLLAAAGGALAYAAVLHLFRKVSGEEGVLGEMGYIVSRIGGSRKGR